MKQTFTQSVSVRALSRILAACLVIFTTCNAIAQTEGFEDEGPSVPTDGINYLTTFTQSGVSFSSSGRLVVFGNTGSAFGADGSHYYLHTRAGSPNTGNIGSFTITTTGKSFRISSFAAYISSLANGNTPSSGNVTFTGNLAAGGTATETITINSTNIGSGYDLSNSFVSDLANASITSLQITLPSGIQYIGLDNIVFTTADIVTSQYSISDAQTTEGTSGTKNLGFTVTRTQTGTAGSVTVNTQDISATAGSDYVALVNQVVSFGVGEGSKTLNVTINSETTPEPDETFFVNLSSPVNGSILDGQGTGTILDDDSVTETFTAETPNGQNFSESSISFSSTGALLVSSNGGAGGSGGASLDTRIGNGPTSPGVIGTFGITTPATSFNIVAIDVFTSNNDGTGSTAGQITFKGTKADQSGTVSYTANTVVSGLNFTTVAFAGTPLANVQLTSIEITLGSGLNYVAFDNFKFGTGVIESHQLSIDDVTAIEGTGPGNTNMVFTITRTSNSKTFTVDVALNHVTSNNADLVSVFSSTTLNFTSGGALTQTVTVPISRDADAEPNEVFNIVLTNATNSVTILDGLGIGKINDDDGVIETFEDEVGNASSFSQNSIAFSTTGQLRVRNSTGVGSNSSNFFLDTGLGNGGSPLGSVGSASITTVNKGFKIISLDCWTSSNDGNVGSQSNGVIRFKGTLPNGTTVETDKNIQPSGDIPGGWVQNIGFGGTPLDNVVLSSIEVIIVSGANYVSIDNFSYVTANTDPEIEVVDANSQIIDNGGGNSPAVGNNTDFGGVCLTDVSTSKTFTVKNLAALGNLTLNGDPKVVLGGAGATHFSVTSQPAGSVSALGSTTFTILYDPSAVGTHDATVTISNNDLDEGSYTFNIRGTGNAHPDATITADTEVCQGTTLDLTVASAGSGATYAWTGNGIVAANAATTTAKPTATGSQSYSIIVTDGNGCSSEGSTLATVNATSLPTVNATTQQSISNDPLSVNTCEWLAKVVPSGSSPVSGNVTVSAWIETDPTFKLVRRHYEVTPETAPSTATGTVTLYFTQDEFDDYNETLSSGFLPANPGDNTANVEIVKYSGVSVPNDGLPQHYASDDAIVVTPNSVIWNAASGFWEVTFQVTSGFSGFFVKSTSVSLPVTLISFSGKKSGENQNTLNWLTADEKDFDRFEIQRSADARAFETIGTLSGTREQVSYLNNYQFVDKNASGSNYYRLKMVDTDGTFSFSKIISIENAAESIVIGSFYPNPATEKAFIDIYATESGNWVFTTFDNAGRVIQTEQRSLKKGMNTIFMDKLGHGMNLVRFANGNLTVVRKIVAK